MYVRSLHRSRVVSLTGDEQEDPAETIKELDEAIAKANAEIERLAPNMKALDRWVMTRVCHTQLLNPLFAGSMTSRRNWSRPKRRLIRPGRTRRQHGNSSTN